MKTLAKISLTYDDGSQDLMVALDDGLWAMDFGFDGRATAAEHLTMWLLKVKGEYHVVPDDEGRAVIDEDGELVGHLDCYERWYKTREQALARRASLGPALASALEPCPVVMLRLEVD